MVCPNCKKEIKIDMELIMQALKAEPGFMEALGKAAAEAYIKSK